MSRRVRSRSVCCFSQERWAVRWATPREAKRRRTAPRSEAANGAAAIDLGARPAFLVNDMRDGELKTRLQACLGTPPRRTAFSIGHRGAGIRFPEHTQEAYEAGYRMGAGMLECDVTFTKDLALVCRHSQNDLATTTNILVTPLAATCVEPFRAAKIDADGHIRRAARAECRTSELTLAEFKSLRGKIDAFNPAARTPEEFIATTPAPRDGFEPGVASGTLLTHAESIALFRDLGVKMTPELKEPSVRMPFNGFTQAQFAQKLVDEYVAARVDPAEVFVQSFDVRDVRYLIERDPRIRPASRIARRREPADASAACWPTRALQGAGHQHLGRAAVRVARARRRGPHRRVEARARGKGRGSRHHRVDARALGQPRVRVATASTTGRSAARSAAKAT